MKKAFTLIELIFVIVIIGVLAAVAIPKFSHLSSNAKISSEMATAATVQSALDDIHADWITAEGTFSWGNGNSIDCNNGSDALFDCDNGYPKKLGECAATNSQAFKYLLKNPASVDAKWSCTANNDYHGPASSTSSGIGENSSDKPDSTDHWEYNDVNGTFILIEG
ncbi:type II secretion system GspH family protein [Sulfurimonas sp. NW15]|uniref:type II secretion system protein n=1 Tax=Sulfurimonas TaxID=202746 RepID=UPI00125F49C3|nr:type II secretion system protein [Sulfurimonas hydrogeniphila]